MSTYYWGFWYALIFLSRVPGPYLQRVDKEVQQAAMWFYPIVGAILGVFLVSLVLLCYLYNPQASFGALGVFYRGNASGWRRRYSRCMGGRFR